MGSVLTFIGAFYVTVAFLVLAWLLLSDLLWASEDTTLWDKMAIALLWPVIFAVNLGKSLYWALWEICK